MPVLEYPWVHVLIAKQRNREIYTQSSVDKGIKAVIAKIIASSKRKVCSFYLGESIKSFRKVHWMMSILLSMHIHM